MAARAIGTLFHAFQSSHSEAEREERFPRVFLYEDDLGVLRPSVSRELLIGDRTILSPTSGLATTYDQASLIGLLYDGLRSFITPDAAAADVLVSFAAIRLPPLHRPENGTRVSREHEMRACKEMYQAARSKLRFLNSSNERRHFRLIATSSALGYCLDMVEPQEQLTLPRSTVKVLWDGTGDSSSGILQMPCPSSIRWSSALDIFRFQRPWSDPYSARPYLMSYVGSQNTPLKAKLISWCRQLGPPICGLLEADNGAFPQYGDEAGRHVGTMRAALLLRKSSIFCLEPPGLSPGRKSQMDALLSGCIPVFFWDQLTHDQFLPWHFGWRELASVRLEPTVLDDRAQRAEAARRLVQLNASGSTGAMREAIAQHAHSLVYSLEGVLPGDAVHTVIRRWHRSLTSGRVNCMRSLPAWRC